MGFAPAPRLLEGSGPTHSLPLLANPTCLFLTCQRAGVSESPYVGVRQLGEQRDEGVHQVTVKYNAVLTLSHEHGHEVAELGVEPAAVRSGLGQWILATVLQRGGGGSREQTL